MSSPPVTFDGPYPKTWSEISGFSYDTPLQLRRDIKAVKTRRKKDADYIVAADYTVSFKVDGRPARVTVPAGMATDLASVPRFSRSVVGRVGPHLEASIVHDYLYIAWQDLDGHGARKQDRDFADELLRVAMDEAKVGKRNLFIIHRAVRLFGWSVYQS